MPNCYVSAGEFRRYLFTGNAFDRTGLKVTAGHQTMSGQDDYLSGQNLGLAVILTSHVHGFQIIN